MDTFERLDRHLHDFRWSLAEVEMLETFATCALWSVLTAGIGVGVFSRVSEAEAFRWALLAVWLVPVSVWIARTAVRLVRRLRDPVALAIRLRAVYPEVGPGLQTVVTLRPALADPARAFSEALLLAEAERCNETLASLPPRPAADLARTRRLIAVTGVVVAALVALSLTYPAEMARGVRRMVGIRGRTFIPAWVALPPEPVDALAYDLRTTWVVKQADETIRIPIGETGDILAPPGIPVEVAGNLVRPVEAGSAVLAGGDRTVEVPLDLSAPGRFSFVVPEVVPGVWFLDVVGTDGVRYRETARRRMDAGIVARPRVSVREPGRIGLKPGDTHEVSFAVESPTGISRVEAVVVFPFAANRPPVRVRLLDPAPGVRTIEGKMTFTWPVNPEEVSGRADLVIEVHPPLSGVLGEPGRSDPVRFVLDIAPYNRLSDLEEAEDAVGALARVLADLEQGAAPDSAVSTRAAEVARGLRDLARREARPEGVQALERAAAAVERVAGVPEPDSTRDQMLSSIGSALLDLDAKVSQDRAVFLSLRLGDLEREGSHLQGAAPEALAASLARVRGTLAVLAGLEQRQLARARGSAIERVAATRRAEACLHARDLAASAFDALRTGEDRERLRDLLARCEEALATVQAAYLTFLSSQERTVFGEVAGADVAAVLKEVLDAQRDIHDRTAQVAFEWKQRVVAASPPNEVELREKVREAQTSLARIPSHRLDPTEATEVARIQEGVDAVASLFGAADYASGQDQARGLVERMLELAAELEDQADWAAQESSQDPRAWAESARRLRQAAAPLREVVRTLQAWRSRPEETLTPAMREEVSAIAAAQGRLATRMDPIVEALGRTTGGWARELSEAAQSARRNMTEAVARLAEAQPASAETHQRQAVQDLLRLKRFVERGPIESLRKQSREAEEDRVVIAAPRPGPPADDLRREIQERQDLPAPPGLEDLVRAYYESLVR